MLHKQLLILVFFITSLTFSQTANDTLVAYQYLKKSDSLFQAKEHNASIGYLKKALPIYKKVNNWKKIARCYNRVSTSQLYLRMFEKSLQNTEKAIEICDKHLKKLCKEKADAYSNIGEYYVKKLDYEKGNLFHQKALDIRLKIFPENHLDVVSSYDKIGFIYQRTSNYKKALKHYERALEIALKTVASDHQVIGNEYNNLGNISNYLGELDKAIEYYKKYLAITSKNYGEDHILIAYGYTNLGATYNKLKRSNDALNYYEKAIPICIRKNNKPLLLGLYNNLGVVLELKGAYNKALEYFKKSLDIRLKIYKKDHPKIAVAYNAIGSIFENKHDYKSALNFYQKALKINKSLHGENHLDVSYCYSLIASSYKKNKQYDFAEEYLNKAISIRSNILRKNTPLLASNYSSLAEIYFQKGDYNTALSYFQKSFKILDTAYGKEHCLNTQSYINLANVNIKLFQYHKALIYLDKALQVNTINKNIKNTFAFYNYYDLLLLLETLKKKAIVLQLSYKKSEHISFLNQSISIYQKLDSLFNQIRYSYQNKEDKISFAKKVKDVYTHALNTQFLKYNATLKQEDLENMFYFAEKSKANTLKELLSEGNANHFSGIAEDLLAEEQTFKTNHAFYKSQIAKEQSNKNIDSVKLISYENKLFTINRKQDSLKQIFKKKYPKYHQLKYQNQIVLVSKIQQKLDDKKMILEFFTTDSITYAFTISKNNIAVKKLLTPKLTEKVRKLQLAITTKNSSKYRDLAYTLYEELILPIADKIKGNELIIVPDESLWHLNFDLLLTKKENASNQSKNLSYFLRDYAVSYANSATLLLNPLKENNKTQKLLNECLAFSFSKTSKIIDVKTISMTTLRNSKDDLPGTRKEIKAISNIIEGQYYYGNQAIEANFKKNASQYSILHLALHGEIDEENPENSKLYFTKSKDSIEDNLLYSHELFNLDIPAELAVLSACNTGTGKIAKGEGIMSLGNAFQYAGTKSLLLSHWELSDITTPELIKYFYTNLKAGMNKAKALQQAKLKYLNTADTLCTSPFFWGSFYLVGDTTPINFKNSLNTSYWVIGIIILIIFTLVIYKRIKNTTIL